MYRTHKHIHSLSLISLWTFVVLCVIDSVIFFVFLFYSLRIWFRFFVVVVFNWSFYMRSSCRICSNGVRTFVSNIVTQCPYATAATVLCLLFFFFSHTFVRTFVRSFVLYTHSRWNDDIFSTARMNNNNNNNQIKKRLKRVIVLKKKGDRLKISKWTSKL